MKQKIEKIRNFISKHDELFFTIVAFVMTIGYCSFVQTIVCDEIWNFQNIYKIYNGYKIYVDTNNITTPLFFLIGNIIFKIFGANFFVIRMYYDGMCIFLFLGIYKIFKTLNIRKTYSFYYTVLMILLLTSIRVNVANYTLLAVIFVVYAILIVLKREKINNYCICESILIFLIFLAKQNIVVFYIIGYNIYFLFNKNKNIKEEIKIIIYNIIYISIFIIVLYFNNNLKEFLNYAVFGLKDFTINFTVQIQSTILIIAISFLNIYLLFLFEYKNLIKDKEKINIFVCFAYPMILVIYPLLNKGHTDFALVFQYIILFFLLNQVTKEKYKKSVIYVIGTISVILLCVSSVRYMYWYSKKLIYSGRTYDDIYFGTLFDEELENNIRIVSDYMQKSNKKVIVISSDAALYMMPFKQNNGALDMILKGNLGKDGENAVIEKISKLENVVILINEKEASYQSPETVKEYVKQTYEYKGKLENFLIYEK